MIFHIFINFCRINSKNGRSSPVITYIIKTAVVKPGSNRPDFLSNNAGGIAGGISTGQPVVVRVAFKPTSSILTPVPTVNKAGEATDIVTKGRHDPCVGIRGAPVVEAMMALVLADHKLLHRAQNG